MAELNTLSNVAGDHSAAPPEGAPEGWTGDDVNAVVRELMAKLYRFYERPEWLEPTYRLAAVGAKTFTRISDSQIQIANCNALNTASGHPGWNSPRRRIRLISGVTEYLGYVDDAGATYGAPHTTVNVVMDGGVVPAVIDEAYIHVAPALQRHAFVTPGADETVLTSDGTHASFESVPAPTGYRYGCALSRTGTTLVQLATGALRSAADAATMRLTSALDKDLNSGWAVGDGNGGRAGALTNGTWYHVFLIMSAAGVVDAGFDTSLTAANLLATSGYTQYRRVGSVYYIDGASGIRDFVQQNDRFYWKSPVLDLSAAAVATTATLHTLTNVPNGLAVIALLNVYFEEPTAGSISTYLSSPSVTDMVPSTSAAPLVSGRLGNTDEDLYVGHFEVLTNTSRQIRSRALSAERITVATLGWIDPLP